MRRQKPDSTYENDALVNGVESNNKFFKLFQKNKTKREDLYQNKKHNNQDIETTNEQDEFLDINNQENDNNVEQLNESNSEEINNEESNDFDNEDVKENIELDQEKIDNEKESNYLKFKDIYDLDKNEHQLNDLNENQEYENCENELHEEQLQQQENINFNNEIDIQQKRKAKKSWFFSKRNNQQYQEIQNRSDEDLLNRIEFNEHIKIIESLENLVANGFEYFNYNLHSILNSEAYLCYLVDNYDELYNENFPPTQIQMLNDINEGIEDFSNQPQEWIKSVQKTILCQNNIIKVQSWKELKNFFNSNNLNKLLNNKDSSVTYGISQTSKIFIYKDVLNVNVYRQSSNITNNINLIIPLSSIKFFMKDVDVQVQINNNVRSFKTNIEIISGISYFEPKIKDQWFVIDSEFDLEKMKDIVLKELNWYDIINNQLSEIKISRDLKLYNMRFSDFRLVVTNNYPIGSKEFDSNYSLIFNVKPKDNFCWLDGTTETKQLVLNNIKISLKKAIWENVRKFEKTSLMVTVQYYKNEFELKKRFNSIDKQEEIMHKIRQLMKEELSLWNVDIKYCDVNGSWNVDYAYLKIEFVPLPGYVWQNLRYSKMPFMTIGINLKQQY